MPIDVSEIPRTFMGEIPRPDYTLEQFREAVENSECAVLFTRDVWIYTTFLQDLFNGIRQMVAGAGFERAFSVGSSIRICFYCPSDSPTGSDPRTLVVSRTIEFSPECTIATTEVSQSQIEVRREWVRWCLTLSFRDDLESEFIQTTALSIISLLGIKAEGVIDVVSALVGPLVGFGAILEESNSEYLFIARDTADGGTRWVNSGLPSSNVLFGPDRLSDEKCEALLQVFGPSGGSVTIPVPTKEDD